MRGRRDAEAREILALAAEEALAVDHGWVGTEHLLLGLLRWIEETGAGSAQLRQLLARTGLAWARERVLEYVPPEPEESGGTAAALTPRSERVLNHAAGVAADRGVGSTGAEDLLLGLLWEVEGIGARVLADSGLSYGTAADALSIPVSDLPGPPDDTPLGPEVDVSMEELEVLLRKLPDMIPPGTMLAFNLRENGRAYIHLGEGVDAEAYVHEALEQRPQDPA